MCRTQDWDSMPNGLERLWQAARDRKKEKFTALLHHLDLDICLLEEAYPDLKINAAPGVDGMTWQDYDAGRELRLKCLHLRV